MWPISHLWIVAPNCQLVYPRCKTKKCWCCIGIHSQDGAESVMLLFLPLKAANTSLMEVCKQPPLRLPRFNNRNRWCSIDAHFQDGAGSVPLLFLPLKAANTPFMDGCKQSPLSLPKMQSQKSLMLCWHSFSEWGSDHVISHFAHKGCQNIGYA